MRRWNGWGDSSIVVEPKPAAEAYLREALGPGERPDDASIDDVLAQVPPSRLGEHPLVDRDPRVRLRHARGHSFADWVALRGGAIGPVPDGVAAPRSRAEVAELLALAGRVGARVIPYGGGTSVVGHLSPETGDAPTLTIALRHLAALESLDARGHLATFGAGVAGPALEAQLRPHGFTLGHFPQSFEYSTLGGWVATRSSGQSSLRYGRIDDLFLAGHVETPQGPLEIPCFPASAAGPDLRELVLGSEGRLGVITGATVRITPIPAVDRVLAFFLPGWDAAADAVRTLAQARIGLGMLRLSNPVETRTQLALAGHPRLLGALGAILRLRGVGDDKCMLLVGVAGGRAQARFLEREVHGIIADFGGAHGPAALGRAWQRGRFRNAYLRNSLWERGYGIDTVETAVPWARVTRTMHAIEAAAQDALEAPRSAGGAPERGLVFSHLSHVYPQGSSIYTTMVFRLSQEPAETLARWQRLKGAVSAAIVACGGTISHQHGVGVDHRPYLPAEKGALGITALGALFRAFDPEGLMNPGKLIEP